MFLFFAWGAESSEESFNIIIRPDFSLAKELYLKADSGAFVDSPELILVQNNTLISRPAPVVITTQVLGQILGSVEPEPRREIIEYEIQSGDSLWSIAERFGLSIDTIVWANDVKSAMIRPGQKILILPVDGVMHLTAKGDTLGGLAEKYKTDIEKILAFNNLSAENGLRTNEVLIIPGGRMPSYSNITSLPTDTLANLSTNNFYGQSHNFPYGQCTWWVAQKRAIPSWGNAKDWLGRAEAAGRAVCKGRYCVPQSEAVISLQGHRLYGHVGYVETVKGDKVTFSEMNYIGWGRMNYRTLSIGSALIRGYIY